MEMRLPTTLLDPRLILSYRLLLNYLILILLRIVYESTKILGRLGRSNSSHAVVLRRNSSLFLRSNIAQRPSPSVSSRIQPYQPRTEILSCDFSVYRCNQVRVGVSVVLSRPDKNFSRGDGYSVSIYLTLPPDLVNCNYFRLHF